jgi:hypothetical protein
MQPIYHDVCETFQRVGTQTTTWLTRPGRSLTVGLFVDAARRALVVDLVDGDQASRRWRMFVESELQAVAYLASTEPRLGVSGHELGVIDGAHGRYSIQLWVNTAYTVPELRVSRVDEPQCRVRWMREDVERMRPAIPGVVWRGSVPPRPTVPFIDVVEG